MAYKFHIDVDDDQTEYRFAYLQQVRKRLCKQITETDESCADRTKAAAFQVEIHRVSIRKKDDD